MYAPVKNKTHLQVLHRFLEYKQIQFLRGGGGRGGDYWTGVGAGERFDVIAHR